MKNKIDVLMATYNGEAYLEEQIKSILNQTYKNFNLIISDDNSIDKTLQILKKYQILDNRITVYHQSKNLGYIKNFEYLCKKARSKYFALSDQDDIWDKRKLEEMIEYLQIKNASLVYCDLTIVDRNSDVICESMIRYMNKLSICMNENDYNLLKFDNVVTGCAMLGLTNEMKKAIPFPTKIFVHDWWIATICSQSGKVVYYDKSLISYRQHDKNTIGIKSQNKKFKSFKNYRKEIIDFKIEQYESCIKNEKKFSIENRQFNEQSLKLFKTLKSKRRVKFNDICKYYKNESVIKKIKKVILFCIPSLAKILFDIRNFTKKVVIKNYE